MNIHCEVSHHEVCSHLYHFCFSSKKKILSSPAPCSPTRLVCCKASPTFAAAHKLCMSQSSHVFPYSCFYLPVCSTLVPYDGRIELFIAHYGAVQKNNLTSVLTLASYLLHSFIVLLYTSLILRIRHKFIDDIVDYDDRNNVI